MIGLSELLCNYKQAMSNQNCTINYVRCCIWIHGWC